MMHIKGEKNRHVSVLNINGNGNVPIPSSHFTLHTLWLEKVKSNFQN